MQSFLDFNNFFMYRLKKFFFITKQALIKHVIKEWNIEWLAERIETVKLNLLMYSFNLLVVLVGYSSQVSDGCLKLLEIARIVLFVFFPTLNQFYLTQNLYFHLLLYLRLYWLEYFLLSKSLGITKVIEGQFIYSSSKRMFAKVSF